jgi:hypothetical protein
MHIRFLRSDQSQILQLTTQCQNYIRTSENTPQALTLKMETAVFAETLGNLLRSIFPKIDINTSNC